MRKVSNAVIGVIDESLRDATLDAVELASWTLVANALLNLEEANSTFVLAVADEHMDDVLASFERSSQVREIDLPLSLRERLEDWRARTVRHGGATILITDLERIHHT